MIEFNLGAAAHQLSSEEGLALYGLLQTAGSLEAESLAASIGRGISGERRRRIRLGLDDIGALRDVLGVNDVSSFDGLVGLKEALASTRREPRDVRP